MDDHWLARASTIRRLWILFVIILAVAVGLDFVIEHHPLSGLAGTFGFGAWFGFATCIALVAVAKALGVVLKRPEGYYDR